MSDLKKINKILKDNDIELCYQCNGKETVWDDSFGSGSSDTIICPSCDGSGRIRQITCECIVTVPFNFKVNSNDK
jgi:DnaJ-class molecular chaperone